jgi:hypothetical protein
MVYKALYIAMLQCAQLHAAMPLAFAIVAYGRI